MYFSEELKAVEKGGYKIELIKGYTCYGSYLFNDYIDPFYSQKKVAAR